LSDFVFEVRITNHNLSEYLIQDTSSIKKFVSESTREFITAEVELAGFENMKGWICTNQPELLFPILV
jgi:hypothetical protein